MELYQQEDAVAFKKSAYSRDDHIILEPESISLFEQGISLILSRWVRLQVIVADPLSRSTGLAEYLRLTCGKVKHEAVEKMAADILAFFMKPEEHCIVCIHKETKEPCRVEHVQFLLHEYMKVTFKYLMVRSPSMLEAAEKLFNLHQDFLQGKYDSVEKLRKTLSWIGEDQMEEFRKEEKEDLIAAHKTNKHRKISRRQRLKFRAYFL